MEIHIQQCQSCGSNELKNILHRVEGERDRVFVQCQKCEAFVASYVISPMGYYHHGKGFESFVRSYQRGGEFMSGRRVQQIFEERKVKELRLFEKVQEYLKKREEK